MSALVRILDANLNRAREALRVLEDAARFGLDDAPRAAAFKRLRHALQDAAGEVPVDRSMLMAWRTVSPDVGRASGGRYARAGLAGVVAAAASRLSEALRAVEEACRGLGAEEAGRAVERVRYAGYDACAGLEAVLSGARARQWTLCVLITGSLCRLGWERVASEAIEGGADCVQLREKTLADGELRARARRLVQMARERSVSVIVNDRPDIALLAGADGVHLGQGDLSVGDVRRLAGGRLLVGVSTANIEQARRARDDGADYCGVGPMFPTRTKDKPVLAGPDYLREYLAHPATAGVPHLAIGGIAPDNVGELRAAGCRGVAVSAGVCGAEDPGRVCRSIVEALGAG